MSCDACGHQFVVRRSISEFDSLKAEGCPCEACDQTAQYLFDPSSIQISMKGDAWSDKNYREKEYRKNRSARMQRRQADSHHVPQLVPNYGGEETGTWREAREAARSEGKATQTYDNLVQKEVSS